MPTLENNVIPLILRRQEPKALLLNDSLNWHHFGHSLSGVWLYQQLLSKSLPTRIPTQTIAALAGSAPSIDQWHDPRHWQQFKQDNAKVANRVIDADKILVNGEAITDGMLLLYLAFCAANFESKAVAWANHALLTALPDQQTTDLLAPVYQTFNFALSTTEVADSAASQLGLTSHLCVLPMYEPLNQDQQGRPPPSSLIFTTTSQTSEEYLMELNENLVAHPSLTPILLVGGRAAISPADIAAAESLAPHVQIRWARNEMEWHYYLANAARVVTGQPHAANIALKNGIDLSIPDATPSALRQQIRKPTSMNRFGQLLRDWVSN